MKNIIEEWRVVPGKRRLYNGEKVKDIVRFFGTKTGAIYDIKQGRTWKHVI